MGTYLVRNRIEVMLEPGVTEGQKDVTYVRTCCVNDSSSYVISLGLFSVQFTSGSQMDVSVDYVWVQPDIPTVMSTVILRHSDIAQ